MLLLTLTLLTYHGHRLRQGNSKLDVTEVFSQLLAQKRERLRRLFCYGCVFLLLIAKLVEDAVASALTNNEEPAAHKFRRHNIPGVGSVRPQSERF